MARKGSKGSTKHTSTSEAADSTLNRMIISGFPGADELTQHALGRYGIPRSSLAKSILVDWLVQNRHHLKDMPPISGDLNPDE